MALDIVFTVPYLVVMAAFTPSFPFSEAADNITASFKSTLKFGTSARGKRSRLHLLSLCRRCCVLPDCRISYKSKVGTIFQRILVVASRLSS